MSSDAGTRLAMASLVCNERGGWAGLLDEPMAEGLLGDGPGELLPVEEPLAEVDSVRRRLEAATSGSFMSQLAARLATAPVIEVVRWTAPPSERFSITPAAPERASRAHREEEGTWLPERFTERTDGTWSASSLRLEFLWARGGEAGCCDEQWLQERTVRRLELAETVAALQITRIHPT